VRHHVRIRRFLNRPGHHAGAYVYAVVGDSSSCRKPDCTHEWRIDIDLTIADCGRVVFFDFDIDTAAGRRNSSHKIDTLIDALERFRDALAVESERAAATRPRTARRRA
jgi:hypothetical protein